MSLKEKIQEDIKIAMKSGDKIKLGVLLMVLSEIKYGETAPKPIDAQTCIAKYSKKLVDSLELIPADRKGEVQAEIDIMAVYLPKPITEAELTAFLATVSLSGQQMGAVMKLVKEKFPTVDGKLASDIIRKALG